MRTDRPAPDSEVLVRDNNSGENKRSRLKMVGTLLDSAVTLKP